MLQGLSLLSSPPQRMNKWREVLEERGSTPPPSEDGDGEGTFPDYLEIDYEQEIDECSRYTFSGDLCYTGSSRNNLAQFPCGSNDFDGLMTPSFECVSLRLLLGEARRLHLSRLEREARNEEVEQGLKIAKHQWSQLTQRLSEDIGLLAPEKLRRNVASMRLFDPTSTCFCLLDSTSRAQELLEKRENILKQLQKQNVLFLVVEDNTTSCSRRSTSSNMVQSIRSTKRATPPRLTCP
ncbi:hypothetical protein ERJ75_001650700 [Trypanosoma vivax]|nr:hypothetical protein ERJ75_001650700 [Trypanosoma vivax]